MELKIGKNVNHLWTRDIQKCNFGPEVQLAENTYER